MYHVYLFQYGEDLVLKSTELENQNGTVKILIEGSGISDDGENLEIYDEIWVDATGLAKGREATMVVRSDFDWSSRLNVQTEGLA